MRMNSEILETEFIARLAQSFRRRPDQLNQLQESDAELIPIPGCDFVLAATTDVVAEEIQRGLYQDGYRAGWMAVMVNMSDLAAVGANPIGIVIQETLDSTITDDDISEIQRGINDACARCETFVLGGDTNQAHYTALGGTALGFVPKDSIMMRSGCCDGDLLYTTGTLGSGNAFALRELFLSPREKSVTVTRSTISRQHGEQADAELPVARLREAQVIRDFATACIDTSDGFIAAVDQLMSVNSVGFSLCTSTSEMLSRDAADLCSSMHLHPGILLSGIHGEFELLFCIPALRQAEFEAAAREQAVQVLHLGTANGSGVFELSSCEHSSIVDTAHIRNLYHKNSHQLDVYLKELVSIWRSMSHHLTSAVTSL